MHSNEYDEREERVRIQLALNIRERIKRMGKNQDEFAREVGISASELSKSLNEERSFKLGELKGMAEILGITMDELFTGISPENIESHERTKLSTFAIDWLAKTRERNDYLIEMVDIVLNNKEIAESIFTMTYLYCVNDVSVTKFSKDGNMKANLASYISDNDTLMKHAISDFIVKVFEIIKKDYRRSPFSFHAQERENDEKMRVALNELKKSLDERYSKIENEISQENIDFSEEAEEYNTTP